jgi:hypothetical protein
MTAHAREATASEAPALLQAVHATIQAIQTRARTYRWAVACVALALVVPIVLALAFLSWRPLPYVAMVVPVVGTFLVIDSRIVLNWQCRVLDMWLARELTLSELRQMVQAMRHLPTGTVTGMLGRLPASPPSEQPDKLRATGRASIVRDCVARAQRQERRSVLSTAGATLLVCSIAATVSLQAAIALLLAPLGLLLIASSRRLSGRL